MKILILGGTGVIGEQLALSFSNKDEVYVSSRQAIQDCKNIHYIKGNAQERAFVKKIPDEWDVIIDLMYYQRIPVFAENYEVLREKTAHYVFVSSSRVYADSGLNPITEQSPTHLHTSSDKEFLSSNEYAISKALAEDVIMSSSYDRWTILRPYIIYGPSRLQLGPMEKEEWLYRAIKGRTIIFPESLLDKETTLTYCEDAAHAIHAIAVSDNSNRQIFNIATPFHTSWRNVIKIYSEAFRNILGKEMKIMYVNDEVFKTYRPGVSFYQISKDRSYHRIFSTEKLNKLIRTDDFLRPTDGLGHCMREFLQSPQFKYQEWAIEGRKDKCSHELASMGEIIGVKQRAVYLFNRFLKNEVRKE